MEQPYNPENSPEKHPAIEARLNIPNKHEKEERGLAIDQIEKYRESKIIAKLIEEIHTKWREKKPGSKALFDKEFQKEYLLFKIKLSSLIKMIRVFIEKPSKESLSEVEQTSLSISGDYPFNLNTLKNYLKQYETNLEVLKKIKSEDLFKKLSGKDKPIGELDVSIYGNCIVIKCYDDEDYFSLWDSKKVKKTGGFYLNNTEVSFENDKIEFPLIAIRAKAKDELMEAIGEKYEDDFNTYVKECYQEETEKDYEDEEGIETEEFENWREENRNTLWNQMIIDALENKDPYSEGFDFEDEKEILAYRFEIDLVGEHEKQHYSYAQTIIEQQDIEIKLENEEQLDDYLEEILNSFLIRLGDELIAYMKDAASKADYFTDYSGWDSNLEDDNLFFNNQKLDADQKRDQKELKNILKISLSKYLYFYPKDYQKELLKNIKEAIGKDKFEKWKVKEKYNNKVLTKFLKKKNLLETYAKKILYLAGSSSNTKKIISILEVEPVTNWPMIYRWLKNDWSVRRLILEN